MAASLGAGKSGLQPAAGPKGQNHFASPNAALKKPLFHLLCELRGFSLCSPRLKKPLTFPAAVGH